ncbi:hypothetical protein UFOVP83_18 [uncultured Caudovirales phage]|uniref:Uncharacterized protein n=1 Tax=uncultured Caudovirales phage TaxID=2100421 RepID=A0A6J5TB17_9CAUD|nr:hypothetical protein UFOVP83_18 [uncultured Caudovirales phage]
MTQHGMTAQSSADLMTFMAEKVSASKTGVDLLGFLLERQGERKDWFGFKEQRTLAVVLSFEMAKHHGNTMTPDQVTDYASKLCNSIYKKLIMEKP